MSPKKPVEVIVFNNPVKKVQDPQSSKASGDGATSKSLKTASTSLAPKAFDQKKAKYDIRKLAIGGMKNKEKDKAMVDLLVELGAKRPKNACLHPREYLEQLKKKREEEKEKDLKDGIKRKTQRKRKRRDKDDLLSFVDGQKGFYKDGVQFVNSLK